MLLIELNVNKEPFFLRVDMTPIFTWITLRNSKVDFVLCVKEDRQSGQLIGELAWNGTSLPEDSLLDM